jgi:hypothetical protein
MLPASALLPSEVEPTPAVLPIDRLFAAAQPVSAKVILHPEELARFDAIDDRFLAIVVYDNKLDPSGLQATGSAASPWERTSPISPLQPSPQAFAKAQSSQQTDFRLSRWIKPLQPRRISHAGRVSTIDHAAIRHCA